VDYEISLEKNNRDAKNRDISATVLNIITAFGTVIQNWSLKHTQQLKRIDPFNCTCSSRPYLSKGMTGRQVPVDRFQTSTPQLPT